MTFQMPSANRLEELVKEIPLEVIPLVPGFIDRREKEICDLHSMLSAGQFDAIGDLAHRLKGNGAAYGLPFFTDFGIDLEIAAKAKDREQVTLLVSQFSEVIVQLNRAWSLKLAS